LDDDSENGLDEADSDFDPVSNSDKESSGMHSAYLTLTQGQEKCVHKVVDLQEKFWILGTIITLI
jgi:hypothetical protein